LGERVVIPAEAGIRYFHGILDPRFRTGDRNREFFTFTAGAKGLGESRFILDPREERG